MSCSVPTKCKDTMAAHFEKDPSQARPQMPGPSPAVTSHSEREVGIKKLIYLNLKTPHLTHYSQYILFQKLLILIQAQRIPSLTKWPLPSSHSVFEEGSCDSLCGIYWTSSQLLSFVLSDSYGWSAFWWVYESNVLNTHALVWRARAPWKIDCGL